MSWNSQIKIKNLCHYSYCVLWNRKSKFRFFSRNCVICVYWLLARAATVGCTPHGITCRRTRTAIPWTTAVLTTCRHNCINRVTSPFILTGDNKNYSNRCEKPHVNKVSLFPYHLTLYISPPDEKMYCFNFENVYLFKICFSFLHSAVKNKEVILMVTQLVIISRQHS